MRTNLFSLFEIKSLKSDNIWLNRSSIILQLKAKNDVNESLLLHNISSLQHKDEFFIQKAIGWSLRQYGKFNPEFTRKTVRDLELVGLAKQEALKNL